MYTKVKGDPLNFIECLQLLQTLVKNKIIPLDPENSNNVVVYREAGTSAPEGWYSENIFDTARDLMDNADDQRFLEDILEKEGITLMFEDIFGYRKTSCNV